MSPLPFLNSKILLRSYVKRLPQVRNSTRPTILKNVVDDAIGQTNTATRVRQNLEYWATKEPYLSTLRTIAHVDWAVALVDGETPLIALSGWIVDLKEFVASLTMSLHGTPASTVVFKERRQDVAFAFPGIPGNFKSGFTALFRARLTEEEAFRLSATYITSKKISVQFDLVPDNVTRYVAGPANSTTTSTPRIPKSKFQNSPDVLVVGLSNSALRNELMLDILEAGKIRAQTVGFISGGRSADGNEILNFLDHRYTVIVSSYAEAGALIAQMHGHYRKLIVIDPFSNQLVYDLFPSVVALPAIPPLLWIVSDKLEHMPAGLHGDFITFLRWRSPNFAAKLAASLE